MKPVGAVDEEAKRVLEELSSLEEERKKLAKSGDFSLSQKVIASIEETSAVLIVFCIIGFVCILTTEITFVISDLEWGDPLWESVISFVYSIVCIVSIQCISLFFFARELSGERWRQQSFKQSLRSTTYLLLSWVAFNLLSWFTTSSLACEDTVLHTLIPSLWLSTIGVFLSFILWGAYPNIVPWSDAVVFKVFTSVACLLGVSLLTSYIVVVASCSTGPVFSFDLSQPVGFLNVSHLGIVGFFFILQIFMSRLRPPRSLYFLHHLPYNPTNVVHRTSNFLLIALGLITIGLYISDVVDVVSVVKHAEGLSTYQYNSLVTLLILSLLPVIALHVYRPILYISSSLFYSGIVLTLRAVCLAAFTVAISPSNDSSSGVGGVTRNIFIFSGFGGAGVLTCILQGPALLLYVYDGLDVPDFFSIGFSPRRKFLNLFQLIVLVCQIALFLFMRSRVIAVEREKLLTNLSLRIKTLSERVNEIQPHNKQLAKESEKDSMLLKVVLFGSM